MNNTDFKFLVINTKTSWEEGYKENLEVSDAGIALKKVPSHILEREIEKSEGWVKSTDIAVDACGVLYILDAGGRGHGILTYEPANKRTERLRCIGGAGNLLGQFKNPKGIALSPDTLYVADTGNERIQAFARINLQIRWLVENDSGEFRPVDIAVDDIANLYVLNGADRRILKFDKGGRFKGTCVERKLEKPVNIAIDKDGFLYVLDNKKVLKFKTDEKDKLVKPEFNLEKLGIEPSGLAVDLEGNVYVGDKKEMYLFSIEDGELEEELNGGSIPDKLKKKFQDKEIPLSEMTTITKENEDKWVIIDEEKKNTYFIRKEEETLNIYKKIKGEEEERFIHKFSPSGDYAGPLLGYRGPCYGMVMDKQGNFYVITGKEGEIAILKYIRDRYFIKEPGGTFISKALDSNGPDCKWHKIVLDAEIPDKTQINVYYYISDEEKSEQDISEWKKLATFRASEIKLRDALIQERSGRYLWVKLELISSDECKTPKIKSIKAYFPRLSYLRYLPAVYQEDAASSDFLERFLSLFETFLWTNEEEIAQIARYFDVEAAPEEFISWLATWVATIFDESWPEEKRRVFLQRAVELYKKRGTREGLEELIEIYTGNKPLIVENFRLRCVENDDIKSTLEKLFGTFKPYRFCVLLKATQEENESQLKTIKRIIELEKPAHTNAGVVVLQPWIYLDMHTYLGINTYLSKQAMRLGIASVISRDTVLTCIEGAGQIERRSRTGMDTELT